MQQEENWDLIIKPKNKWYQFGLSALWRYRDLMMLLVRRDFFSVYKQTLLGPIWFFIQPIFTTVIYYFMFGRIAHIPTDGKPPLLFYMGGLVCWNYFVECINGTSNVFINNANLFGKVYFPRLIVPVSTIISAGIKFLIQLLLFLVLLFYFVVIKKDPSIHISWGLMFIPLLILLVAIMGMSIGIIISSVTTKYRDLKNVLGYLIQFWLYATPIIYPLSWMKTNLPAFYKLCLANPMSGIVETFKYAFFGSGTFSPSLILYSVAFTVVAFFISLILFNRVEKTFIDTV